METCNHDLKSPSCTVRFLKQRNMVEPNIEYGVCPICGESFIVCDEENDKEENQELKENEA